LVETLDADGLTITVSAHNKYRLTFSQEPPETNTVNVDLAAQPKVQIRDYYGNRTTDTDEVTLSASGSDATFVIVSGSLSADALTVQAVDGEASFSGVQYDTVTTDAVYLHASSGFLDSDYSRGMTFAAANTSTVDAPDTQVSSPFAIDPVDDSESDKFAVLKFRITDSVELSDSLPTLVDKVSIVIGGTGGAASTDIAWAELHDGTERVVTAASITDSHIIFGSAPNGDGIAQVDSIADGTSKEYTVYIHMKNEKLTAAEGETYTFYTDESLVEVDGDVHSSTMADVSGAITAVTGTVTVTMTHFEIVGQAEGNTSATVTAGSGYEMQIRAVDRNRNIDIDYSHGTPKILVFSGLNPVGVRNPGVETRAFGTTTGIIFTNGVSQTDKATLIAYKAESGEISVLEIVGGIEQDYSVLTFGATVEGGDPGAISIVSGNGQTGAVGAQLPDPLMCEVTDIYGNLKAGATVNFAVTGGTGGSLTVDEASTDPNGRAATYLTLGPGAGEYEVTADVAGYEFTPAVFTATAREPYKFIKVSGDGQSAVINTQLSSDFTARMEDISDAPIPNETVTFSIEAPAGAAGYSINPESGVTGSDGSVRTRLTLGDKTGDYYVTMAYPGITSAVFTGTAESSGPHKADLTGPSSVTAGSASTAFTITVQDTASNAAEVSEDTVFNLITTGDGGFYSDPECVTALPGTPYQQSTVSSGSSSVNFYYKDSTAANITITAQRASGDSLPGGASDNMAVTVVPADLSYFTIGGSEDDYTAGAGGRALTVTAYDNLDNVKTNTGTITVTFDGANDSPSGQSPTVNDSAAAFTTGVSLTFNSSGVSSPTVKLYKAESVSITASSGSADTAAPLAFNVLHGAADHTKFNTNLPSPVTAGTQFNLDTTLNVVDRYDNICDGANGATAYSEAGRTVSWTLSGEANSPDGQHTDSYTSPVSFTNGRSTTTLSAALYRAQNTTITSDIAALPKEASNVASNTITVSAGAINKLNYAVQPAASAVTSQAWNPQPVVSVADAYGNPVSAAVGEVTVSADNDTDADNAVSLNGALQGTRTKTISDGQAVFTDLKYTYPETIYLKAAVTGQSLDATYSNSVSLSAAADLSVTKVISGVSGSISSVANTAAEKVAVFRFKITDGGADGLDGKITKIVINRNSQGEDNTGGWTGYVNEAYISDGVTEIGGAVADNSMTFGGSGAVIYTISDATDKTFTLSMTVKTSLPAGADGKALDFIMDADDDLLLGTASSVFEASAPVSNIAAVSVVATDLAVTGSESMAAGGTNTITLTARDANGNIDLDYEDVVTGKSITFSGANASSLGDAPTVRAHTGTNVEFGTVTNVKFSNGVASAVEDTDQLKMKLYKAETAVITASDGAISTRDADSSLYVTVSGGTASQLSWGTQPVANVAANAPFNVFTLNITDAYGNTSTSTVEVTATPSAGSVVEGATATATAVAGVASFNNFYVTGTNYPFGLTLSGTAPGLTSSGASDPVTVFQSYNGSISVTDSLTGAHLDELSVSVSQIGETVYTADGTSPFATTFTYGDYTFNVSKSNYIDLSSEVGVTTSLDGSDGSYDGNVTISLAMTSISEATADYNVKSSFVYDEDTQDITIRLWLERRGLLITSSPANYLWQGTVDVYDDSGGEWLDTITLEDAMDGIFTYEVSDVLAEGNDFGRALTSGKSYYAKCKVSYGGSTSVDSARTYETGTTFTLSVNVTLMREVITKMGLEEGETIAGKIEAVQTDVTAARAASETAAERSDIAASEAVTAAAKATEAATGIGAIPEEITSRVTEIAERGVLSEILTRDTRIREDQTINIRYRTDPALAPTITIYDADGAVLPDYSGEVMREIGSTGIYEYEVTATRDWGTGDFTVVCEESTKNSRDSMVLEVKALFVAGEGVEEAVDAIGELVSTVYLRTRTIEELLGAVDDPEDGEEGTVLGIIDELSETIDNLNLWTVATDARNARTHAMQAYEEATSMKSSVDNIEDQIGALMNLAASMDELRVNVATISKGLSGTAPEVIIAAQEDIAGDSTEETSPAEEVPAEIAEESGVAEEIRDFNNRIEELEALVRILTALIEQESNKPIVEGWFES
ncbi:MAG: hypothetical protein WCV56_03490, partial [Candidatus Omnitrophota bacterium]